MNEVGQTPVELLRLILSADEDEQLRICQLAVDASEVATRCFMDGHALEIENLHGHIKELSIALVDAVAGNPIDPGLFNIAHNNASVARNG